MQIINGSTAEKYIWKYCNSIPTASTKDIWRTLYEDNNIIDTEFCYCPCCGNKYILAFKYGD